MQWLGSLCGTEVSGSSTLLETAGDLHFWIMTIASIPFRGAVCFGADSRLRMA